MHGAGKTRISSKNTALRRNVMKATTDSLANYSNTLHSRVTSTMLSDVLPTSKIVQHPTTKLYSPMLANIAPVFPECKPSQSYQLIPSFFYLPSVVFTVASRPLTSKSKESLTLTCDLKRRYGVRRIQA